MCSKPGDETSRLSTLLFVLLCWSLAAEREYKGLQMYVGASNGWVLHFAIEVCRLEVHLQMSEEDELCAIWQPVLRLQTRWA